MISVSLLGFFLFFGFFFILTSSFSLLLLTLRLTPFISSILSRVLSNNKLGVSSFLETKDIWLLLIALALLPLIFLVGDNSSYDPFMSNMFFSFMKLSLFRSDYFMSLTSASIWWFIMDELSLSCIIVLSSLGLRGFFFKSLNLKDFSSTCYYVGWIYGCLT